MTKPVAEEEPQTDQAELPVRYISNLIQVDMTCVYAANELLSLQTLHMFLVEPLNQPSCFLVNLLNVITSSFHCYPHFRQATKPIISIPHNATNGT